MSYNPSQEPVWVDRDGKRWVRVDGAGISLPEYIEGNARGTIRRMFGAYFRQVDEAEMHIPRR